MNKYNYCIFILTHGRPDNIITINSLKAHGYTGRVHLVVDNEDKTAAKYIENFGAENVSIFDKKKYADSVDEGNNFDERKVITHARNACFDIAEKLGIDYFFQYDDDYSSFYYRLIIDNKTCVEPILDLNKALELLIDFYIKNPSFYSIAIAQGGDFLGGFNFSFQRNSQHPYLFSKRKCMNSFLCSPARRFKFIGAMNEDVNTYTTLGSRGALFLTVPYLSLTQKQTQTQSGGITDLYKKYGTYCKSFTTVMMQPSSVKVSMMHASNERLHHRIKWRNTVPKIISDKYQK